MSSRFGKISQPSERSISWETDGSIQSLRDQGITFFSPNFVLENVVWYITVEPKTKDGYFKVSLVFSPLENFHLEEIRVDNIDFQVNSCLTYGIPVKAKGKVKVHTGKNKGASGVVKTIHEQGGLFEIELSNGAVETHTITEIEYVEQPAEQPAAAEKPKVPTSPRDTSVLLRKRQCAHYLFEVDESKPSVRENFRIKKLRLEVKKSVQMYTSSHVDQMFILDSFFQLYTGRQHMHILKLIIAFTQ